MDTKFYKEVELDITLATGVVAHGVNCSGRFNSGVAGAIKKAYPGVEQMFKKIPASPKNLGNHQVVLTTKPAYAVINCFTQVYYGKDGKVYADINAVEKTLLAAANVALEYGKDLYIPKIGCGLGGLNWMNEVEPIVNKVAKHMLNYGKRLIVCNHTPS